MYYNKYQRWSFGENNNKLIDLVLKGIKTATSSIYNKNNIPNIGQRSIIINDKKIDTCLIEITEIRIIPFKNITEDLAILEGEGDKTINYWKKVHYNYFKSINRSFNENTKILFEIFHLIKKM